MRIDSTGKVGIANVPFIPNSPLHLYNSGTSASIFGQVSNGNTNFPNGLRFGINSSNEGVINMYDAKPLNFLTNNTPKMTIIGSSDSTDGFVGIGITVPQRRFHVLDSTTLVSETVLLYTDTSSTPLSFPVKTTVAGLFVAANTDTFNQAGIIGRSINAQGINIGVLAEAINAAPMGNMHIENVGIHARAAGSNHSNQAIYASARYKPLDVSCKLSNDGIHANAGGSPFENKAGAFITEGRDGFNYSVWGRSTHGYTADDNLPDSAYAAQSPRMGLAPYGYAGYFMGDVYVMGSIINHPTDFMPVDNDTTLAGDSALLLLSKLFPKRFMVDGNYKDPIVEFPTGWHYGFDKDSVHEHLPVAMRYVWRPDSYANICGRPDSLIEDSSIVHEEIIPLLVAGVNELKHRVDSCQSNDDLLAMILQLQNDVAVLKEQLHAMVKN